MQGGHALALAGAGEGSRSCAEVRLLDLTHTLGAKNEPLRDPWGSDACRMRDAA